MNLCFRCCDDGGAAHQVLLPHLGQGDQGQVDPGELLQQPDQSTEREEGEMEETGGVIHREGLGRRTDRGEEEPARSQGDRVPETEEVSPGS